MLLPAALYHAFAVTYNAFFVQSSAVFWRPSLGQGKSNLPAVQFEVSRVSVGEYLAGSDGNAGPATGLAAGSVIAWDLIESIQISIHFGTNVLDFEWFWSSADRSHHPDWTVVERSISEDSPAIGTPIALGNIIPALSQPSSNPGPGTGIELYLPKCIVMVVNLLSARNYSKCREIGNNRLEFELSTVSDRKGISIHVSEEGVLTSMIPLQSDECQAWLTQRSVSDVLVDLSPASFNPSNRLRILPPELEAATTTNFVLVMSVPSIASITSESKQIPASFQIEMIHRINVAPKRLKLVKKHVLDNVVLPSWNRESCLSEFVREVERTLSDQFQIFRIAQIIRENILSSSISLIGPPLEIVSSERLRSPVEEFLTTQVKKTNICTVSWLFRSQERRTSFIGILRFPGSFPFDMPSCILSSADSIDPVTWTPLSRQAIFPLHKINLGSTAESVANVIWLNMKKGFEAFMDFCEQCKKQQQSHLQTVQKFQQV